MPSLLTRIGRTIRKKLGMRPTFRESSAQKVKASRASREMVRPEAMGRRKSTIPAIRSAQVTVNPPRASHRITVVGPGSMHSVSIKAPTKIPKPKPFKRTNVAISGPGRTSVITAKAPSKASHATSRITAKAPSKVRAKKASAQPKTYTAKAGGGRKLSAKRASLLNTASYIASR